MSKPSVGWYPDPQNYSRVRLWDGLQWTEHTRDAVPTANTDRELPKFMVVPALCMAPTLLYVAYLFYSYPIVVILASLGLLFTIPAFMWFDKLEPEPRVHRCNAFVWGAGVCVLLAGIINTMVAVVAGLGFSAVVSAPLLEEGLKVLGIVILARKKTIGSPLDGFVYAGYIGLGFASVENLLYYQESLETLGFSGLATVFVFRGLFAPFAHPYFTIWAGLLIGKACRDSKSIFPAVLKGLAIGIPLHAIWNASTLSGNMGIMVVVALVNLGIFFAVTHRMVKTRRSEIEKVRNNIRSLAFTFNISPKELEIYGDLKLVKQFRKSMSTSDRREFDYRYSTIVGRLLEAENAANK